MKAGVRSRRNRVKSRRDSRPARQKFKALQLLIVDKKGNARLAFGGANSDLSYLDVWDRDVTAIEDPELRHSDLGIALLEALAYVADLLSFYQEAVADESFLRTSRNRLRDICGRICRP